MISRSRLNAWLFRVPADAVRLELRHEALSGVVTLCGFTRAELGGIGNLGEVICEAAQDHANASRMRVSFAIVWLDEEGRVLGSKPIRAQPRDDDDDDDGEVLEKNLVGAGQAPREEANTQGIVAQLMRHVENRERMLNIALGTNIKTMHDLVRDSRAEADMLRGELRAERQRYRELETLAAAGVEPDGESMARSEAYSKISDAVVTHLVPLIAERMRGVLQ